MFPVAESLEKVVRGHFMYVKMEELNILAGYLVKHLIYRIDQWLGIGNIYPINFLTGK